MPTCGNTVDLIGNTRIVEIHCFDTGPCRLYVKLENQNPGGSIKDRIALSMIRALSACFGHAADAGVGSRQRT